MESPRKEQSRRYYLKNREKVIAKVRAYRKRNNEQIGQRRREKYAKDATFRKEQLAYQVQYRKENREKVNAYQRRYRKEVLRDWYNEHRRKWTKTEKGRAAVKRKAYVRRARLGKSLATHTETEWRALVEKHGGRCAICKKRRPLTRDHIRPLSKGGDNGIENIQPLCRPCNAKKGATYPYQFKP